MVWGERIRTFDCRIQIPTPCHLATPQLAHYIVVWPPHHFITHIGQMSGTAAATGSNNSIGAKAVGDSTCSA